MKFIPCLLLVLISGCTNKSYLGHMTESKVNPKTGKFESVEYSPYYELEYRTEDNAVLARLVITLGPERVPKGFKYKGRYSEDLNRLYRDGIVEWVSEIYFINTSNDQISLSPIHLKVGNDEVYFENEFSIPPSKWKITSPLIELNSVYGTKSNVRFKFNYGGKEHNVVGVAKRMTVFEVNEKYSPKN